jgi:mRNA-degrading endonuclease RelE of RelBE toxin-antitoxin system
MKAIRRLAATDYGDVVQLKGEDPPQWRLRVGDWRVIFVYRHTDRVMAIVRVLPRGKAYDR